MYILFFIKIIVVVNVAGRYNESNYKNNYNKIWMLWNKRIENGREELVEFIGMVFCNI